MLRRLAILLYSCFIGVAQAEALREQLNLNGTWQFRTDPEGIGVRQEWHSRGVSFPQRLQVPGIWQAQGIGSPDGVLRHNYSGAAWYRREFRLPAEWRGKVIHLRVGGSLRQTAAYVNGRKAGEHDGFSTPFDFDITAFVRFGETNTLAFRIVNPAGNVRDSPDAQVSTEPTGMMNYIGSWGGVYGDVSIEATPETWIDRVVVTPQIAGQRAVLAVVVSGARLKDASIEVDSGPYHTTHDVPDTSSVTELMLSMAGSQLWTPESPFLYTATVRLIKNGIEIDRTKARWGMREFSRDGQVLRLNGKPIYLRGYGDDNVEVLTGVAPASREDILRRIRLARSFGFNAVRFHSMIPSSTYFDAADEAGLLVMAELPASYTMHFLPHRAYLKSEMTDVLLRYRNHPSFLSLAFGNEFDLDWLKTPAEKEQFQSAVADFYGVAKRLDPTRIILSNDGLLLRPSDMVSISSGSVPDMPTVRHEFGEYYCSLPDPSLIEKFSGVLAPTWLESKREWIAKHHLEEDYPDFLHNSQRLQQIGRKYQIERVRRSSEVSGYHYWLITDYPGGTGEGDSWEEGWFDYFWRPKNIVPEEGRELNAAVLLLIDAGVDTRTLWNDESRRLQLTVSNYGDDDIQSGTIRWSLERDQQMLSQGELSGVRAQLGKVQSVGMIQLPAVGGSEAQKLQLRVAISTGTKTYRNHWDFWSFPHHDLLKTTPRPVTSEIRWQRLKQVYPFFKDPGSAMPPDSLLITSRVNPDAVAFLKRGGRVWLMADEAQFQHAGDATFFPASGGALGSRITNHPALQAFPHEGMLDLQFFNLLEGGWQLALDDWPEDLNPIIGGIRTTSSFLSRSKKLSRTGYLFEAGIGKGKLLVSTLKIRERYDDSYPETIFLVDRLLRYAIGSSFRPPVMVSDSVLNRMATAN
jgi:beta-galactosidase